KPDNRDRLAIRARVASAHGRPPDQETARVIIGVPRETKSGEQRVALTPTGVQALVALGHRVLVEPDAGLGSGIRDEEYTAVGAGLKPAEAIWAEAGLVLKVKEPIAAEYGRLHGDQILFTYLHLAAVPELTHVLRKADTIALAYETVQRADGSLPLLTPMSEVAGRLAVQEASFYLRKPPGRPAIPLPHTPHPTP